MKYNQIKLGKIVALLSFVIGTLIFILYYLTSSFILLFVGYGYILFAVIANLIIMATILYSTIKYKYNWKKSIISVGIIFLNFPIMLFYCWITLILLNTMRITFTNTTKQVLTGIKIYGCETNYIERLERGETKTIWIKIQGDCSIRINYLLDGQSKSEEVVGYVTHNDGKILKHNIGKSN